MYQEVMKMVYYAYFHYTMSYGIIFWGNSTDSKIVLKPSNCKRGKFELSHEARI
jgi:hypothetical protein